MLLKSDSNKPGGFKTTLKGRPASPLFDLLIIFFFCVVALILNMDGLLYQLNAMLFPSPTVTSN